MSLEALIWAIRIKDSKASGAALRTLAILADYAGADGQAFPSNARLEEDRGVSRATLYRHLEELHKAGLILPGDQGLVGHLPGNRRPRVWYMNVHARGLIRETPGPARGLIDPPSGVSSGETTEHRKNQEPSKSVTYPPHQRAREATQGRSSERVDFPDRECIHDHQAVMYTDSKSGRTAPRCPYCRKAGRIILAPLPAPTQETTDERPHAA